jgi:EAL domain-containing protein (putative c-di-GMP-specific phosphodiesterase class I)
MRTGGEVLCRMPDLQKRFDIGQIFEGCRNQPVMNRLTMHIMGTMIGLAPLYREALGPSARISMNVDPCLVSNNRFVCSMSDFIDEMQESGLEIELEINEKQLNVMDENFAKNAKFLARRGTRLFIDGFGADKGAFELLRNEYFAGVKLDRGLIGRMMGNRSDDAFVSWIVQICRQIGYSVIAVGVENEATALCLREYGVEELQGYLFGMPQPLEEIVPGKIAI